MSCNELYISNVIIYDNLIDKQEIEHYSHGNNFKKFVESFYLWLSNTLAMNRGILSFLEFSEKLHSLHTEYKTKV